MSRRAARRVWRNTGEGRAVIGLTVVLCLVVLMNDWGVLTPDTKPETFLAPWATFWRSLGSWLDRPFLGGPTYNVGLAPVAALMGVLEILGVPPWLAMRVWRIGLLFVAAWGARRLYQDLTAGSRADHGAGRVAASVAYAANPYLLVGGATTPTLLPYALLPWFVLAFRRGLLGDRGWRWPALAALSLAAMSGINAGVVPLIQLSVLLPVAAHAVLAERVGWGRLVGTLSRTMALYGLLSLYWLVPAAAALSTGAAVAAATESIDAITAPSSWGEVVRGLGFWGLYGQDGNGPFDPDHTAYLTNPLVVLFSFSGFVVAVAATRLSRHPARLLGILLVTVGAAVMVGGHRPEEGAPLARAFLWMFDNVPGFIAFRTTNKAGAVLELGTALLVGLGAAALLPRLRTDLRRYVAAGLAAVAVVGSVAPAFTGHLHSVRLRVPGYWREAARAVDAAGDPDARVLFVPGAANPTYTWGYSGPDELGNALFRRPTTYRSAVPNGTPWATNLMVGVDQRLQDGTLPPGTLSALARYIGASDVLARYDLVSGKAGGARPGVVEEQLADDPGLAFVDEFGRPGQNLDPAETSATLAPLRHFGVTTATGEASSVVSAEGSLLVDGDGAALPLLQEAGLLEGDPVLLYAGSQTEESLRRALGSGTSIVLTDTNARRIWNNHAVTSSTALLPASADATGTRALFDADSQTVAEPLGNATVSELGPGIIFGPVATGALGLAFDGDPTTGWETGNFQTGRENGMEVRLDRARDVPRVGLRLPDYPSVRISRATVTVSGGERSVRRTVMLSPRASEVTSVDLGDARGDRVTIEIVATEGEGIGPVGLAEVEIPGVTIGTSARMPVRLASMLDRLEGADAEALARTPLSVMMRRALARGTTSWDDEEPKLQRTFTLPDERTFLTTGRMRLADGVTDQQLDAILGTRSPQGATILASSRRDGRPSLRAAAALDGAATAPDVYTAWQPADPVNGEWIEARFPARTVESISITQPTEGAYAGAALVSVDGGPPERLPLGRGRSELTLPPSGPVSSIRVTLAGRSGSGAVKILDLGIDDIRSGATTRRELGCLTMATVDGRALRGRPADPEALQEGAAVDFEPCEPTLTLDAGEHRVRGVQSVVLDSLTLAPAGPQTSVPAWQAPVEVLAAADGRYRIRTPEARRPYYLVLGQGMDEGWVATSEGRDLGRPVLVNGYSAGWLIPDGEGHVIDVTYRPQEYATISGLVSLATLLGCLVLGLGIGRRWWIRTRREDRRHVA